MKEKEKEPQSFNSFKRPQTVEDVNNFIRFKNYIGIELKEIDKRFVFVGSVCDSWPNKGVDIRKVKEYTYGGWQDIIEYRYWSNHSSKLKDKSCEHCF